MPGAFAVEYADDPWIQSVLFYFSAPWQLIVFHVVFLLFCLAFIVGCRTSCVKWVFLIGSLSLVGRADPVPDAIWDRVRPVEAWPRLIPTPTHPSARRGAVERRAR